MSGHCDETLLITGLPGFRAQKLCAHLLLAEPDASLIALVRDTEMGAASEFREALAPAERERLRIQAGDPFFLDYGLSGPSYLELARSVDRVYHFASVLESSAGELGASSNLAGARELIEFSRCCSRLRGAVVLSSAFVSGARSGVILEEELAAGQRFRGAVDESLALVEQMLERHPELPALVLRPTQIVGDSRTGQIDRVEWPYPLIAWVVGGPDEISLALPRAQAALQVVPIDFVLRAAHHLASDAGNYGRRYHLVDERPPTIEEFVVLLAEHCNKRISPGLNVLTRGLSSNLRLISDSMRSLFDVQGADATYDAKNARALSDSGIVCPPLESYLPALVEFARRELFSTDKESGRAR
ncbi:MAG TPA: SDR family oxidoreductase [Polyangiaceae bacterium]|jgi:thioester reductase-like protein